MVSRGRVAVGTNVVYAPIHEFGGTIPARIIRPKNSSVLAWRGPDGMRFARFVRFPGATIPARPYLRPALAAMRERVVALIRNVYRGALNISGVERGGA
jgi:phage gpG-like protein